MSTRIRHLSALMALAVGLGTHAASGQKIYWSSISSDDIRDRRIHRANLDGTGEEDLVTTVTIPHSLAIDRAGGKMYWSNSADDSIQRANLDGSDVEEVVTGQDVSSIALDVGSGQIYWTTRDTIFRANLDGSNVEEVLVLESSLREITLDRASSKMYWIRWRFNPFLPNLIQRANLDGTDVEDLVTTGLIQVTGLALDLSGGKMYWIDSTFTPSDAKIQRADLDGSNVETLITTSMLPSNGIDLDVASGKMYWDQRSFTGTSIRRASLDGSGIEILLTLDRFPTGGPALDLCGDGLIGIKTGEQCDDAGESLTCDVDCTFPACGDGVLNTTVGEVCDDGFNDACGSCNVDCTGPGTGSTCGDGVVTCPETEACDDGFTGDCGICNADCTGPGTGSTCGDGLFCPETEACDDGNTESGDGCDANCQFDLGACCFGVGCDITTQAGCSDSGGTFLGVTTACDTPDGDGDGLRNECDGCPTDSNKIEPGICGCGRDDFADLDDDGVPDCTDQCRGVDDTIFAPECDGVIPTVSEWGLLILALLLLVAGKVYFGHRAEWPV